MGFKPRVKALDCPVCGATCPVTDTKFVEFGVGWAWAFPMTVHLVEMHGFWMGYVETPSINYDAPPAFHVLAMLPE